MGSNTGTLILTRYDFRISGQRSEMLELGGDTANFQWDEYLKGNLKLLRIFFNLYDKFAISEIISN